MGATNAKNVTSECRTPLRRPIVLVLGRGRTRAFPYFPLGSGPAESLVPMTDNVLEWLAPEESKFVRCSGGRDRHFFSVGETEAVPEAKLVSLKRRELDEWIANFSCKRKLRCPWTSAAPDYGVLAIQLRSHKAVRFA